MNGIQEVRGSIPLGSTSFPPNLRPAGRHSPEAYLKSAPAPARGMREIEQFRKHIELSSHHSFTPGRRAGLGHMTENAVAGLDRVVTNNGTSGESPEPFRLAADDEIRVKGQILNHLRCFARGPANRTGGAGLDHDVCRMDAADP